MQATLKQTAQNEKSQRKKLPRIMEDETKLYNQQTLPCRATESTQNQSTGTKSGHQPGRYNMFLEERQHPVPKVAPATTEESQHV